jgi:hypothetical protein
MEMATELQTNHPGASPPVPLRQTWVVNRFDQAPINRRGGLRRLDVLKSKPDMALISERCKYGN